MVDVFCHKSGECVGCISFEDAIERIQKETGRCRAAIEKQLDEKEEVKTSRFTYIPAGC